MTLSRLEASGVWPAARPRFVPSIPRRGRFFRGAAHLVVWAFLAQVLPATAFADLSVPLRIPIVEWRAAIRKDLAVEYLCVKDVPRDKGDLEPESPSDPEPRSVGQSPLLVRVSQSRRPRTLEEAIAQGYTCREVPRGTRMLASWSPGGTGERHPPNGPSTVAANLAEVRRTGRARIPMEEYRAVERKIEVLQLDQPTLNRVEESSTLGETIIGLVQEVQQWKTHDRSVLHPRAIAGDERVAAAFDRSGGVNRIGQLDLVVSGDLGGEFDNLVGHSNKNHAAVLKELLELLDSGDVPEADWLDQALGARQDRGKQGATWRRFSAFDPTDCGGLFARVALYAESENARIEIEPHRPQSRISRISASISSPVLSPGGKERTYADRDRFGLAALVYTTTSTLSASGGSGASSRIAPSSMCAGIVCASMAEVPSAWDAITATVAKRRSPFVARAPVVPTPNPSHVADGVSGRGSWHVGRGPRAFRPRPNARLTAEVERSPFSPSARAGFRSLGGNVQLNVAAGSLDEDTAIALWSYDEFSPFIPSTNGITPLGEVTVDFASSILNTSAALTFRNVAAAPGDTLVIARVDRAAYDGFPRLQVVALADVVSANGETNAVTRVDTGLPGLTLEGIRKEARYTLSLIHI